jgi:GTP-binding protein Era
MDRLGPSGDRVSKDNEFKCGYAGLIGRPNAGKSTLLNRVLGQKLAIVTAKPQTTRSRILGIHVRPDAQVLFLDTPGLHISTKVLNASLNEVIGQCVRDCDVGLVLVDLARGWTELHDKFLTMLRESDKPTILVGSKLDLANADKAVWPPPEAQFEGPTARISALTGEGVNDLVSTVASLLPVSPPLYDPGDLTDRPLRWLVAELVREAVFESLGQELPYSMAVDVVEFDEARPDLVKIRANLLVERDSQKPIVVGKGGSMIKRIGIRARGQVEKLLGSKVHLELFVKVDPRWLKSPERIERLGYC